MEPLLAARDVKARRVAHSRATQTPRVDRLLTAQEVADRLNVSTAWIYAAVGSGHIPHMRLGRSVRFQWPDVEAWLEQIKRPGRVPRNDRREA